VVQTKNVKAKMMALNSEMKQCFQSKDKA